MKQKRWGKRRHGKVLLPRIVGDFRSHLQAVVPEHDNVMTVVGNTNSRKPYTAAATVGAANATDSYHETAPTLVLAPATAASS